MNKMNKKLNGSTIIELLISLMVVGLIVTAVAVSATYSIKNTGEARFKQVATTLGQEAIEKTINEKKRLGFISFSSAVGSNTYCFDTIPTAFDATPPMPVAGICDTNDVVSLAGTDFTREISFSTSATVVSAEVNVSWNDSGNIKNIELIQEFSAANQN